MVGHVPDGTTPTVHPVPRKPYRSPRDWLPAHQRRFFGWGAKLDWLTPTTDLERALLSAAKQQDALAVAIRVRRGNVESMPALAASIDVHLDTIRALLNGSQHANLALISALSNAVGLNVTVATNERAPSPSGSDTT